MISSSWKFDFAHVSSGDALRNQIAAGTPIGKEAESYIAAGTLVPDRIITALVKDELNSKASNPNLLLDGFPRTLDQANALIKKGIEIDCVVEIVVNDTDS